MENKEEQPEHSHKYNQLAQDVSKDKEYYDLFCWCGHIIRVWPTKVNKPDRI